MGPSDEGRVGPVDDREGHRVGDQPFDLEAIEAGASPEARTDVPNLVAEVRRLRDVVARLRWLERAVVAWAEAEDDHGRTHARLVALHHDGYPVAALEPLALEHLSAEVRLRDARALLRGKVSRG